MTSADARASAGNGWADRITFTNGPDPIAYRPTDVVVPTVSVDAVRQLVREFRGPKDGDLELEVRALGSPADFDRQRRRNPLARLSQIRGVPDPLLVVRELRSQGIEAQLNHVFFAQCGDCCGPHPAARCGGPQASPVYATPVYATPVYATPVYATPVYATPVYATGDLQATGKRRSSAKRVALADASGMRTFLDEIPEPLPPGTPISAVVLDVGCSVAGFRGPMLGLVDVMSTQDDTPDSDSDAHLDPAAGHGEFIAGLIKSIAPTSRVAVIRVLHPEGDGDEADIAQAIDGLPDVRPSGGAVLNLSFAGYVLDDKALLMGTAIRDAQARGWVVVAAAGNDATCRRAYPAAFPDVIAVGAIGPHGPAPFTNYGPWVRACAPGVDLVSTFFQGFTDPDLDPDPFVGWAKWSGTSFSAPIVAGVIVQQKLTSNGGTVQDAVTRVVDAPALMRLDGLGTVVNRV